MGVGSYLRLKGRASVFRRKIPEGLRARLARTEICATLGIVSRDSAERGARQVAVAVDAFFASASRNMSLTSTDLSRVVASTIEAWREDDERHDSSFALAHSRTLGSPRENALHFAEMAEMTLSTHGAGVSQYDGGFVAARFVEAGIEAPPQSSDLHRAGRELTLGLSSYYLGVAIELADRHDLGRGFRGVPVERWRTHREKLLRQLGLDEPSGDRTEPPATLVPESASTPPSQSDRPDAGLLPMPQDVVSAPRFSEVIADSLSYLRTARPKLRFLLSYSNTRTLRGYVPPSQLRTTPAHQQRRAFRRF